MSMSRHKAVGLLIVAAALLSTSGLFIKLISWKPLAILGGRSLVALIVFLFYLRPKRLEVSRVRIFGAFGYVLAQLLFITATKMTTAANAIFLQYAMPIHVFLLGYWVLKEKPQRADWISLAFILPGMVLFFGDDLRFDSVLGNILAILSGVAMAVLIVCMRQQNKGVSAARNRGIEASFGRYVAFLDSDDLWLPRKLEAQMAYVRQHPDIRIHQTDEIWIRNGLRVNPGRRHQKPEGCIFEKSLELCLISPSAVWIEQRLFDEVGLFDERYPACEDYDLWLRITCRYPVGLVPEPLIVKRGGHADQLSRLPVLDRYRIESIRNIMVSGMLSIAQHQEAASVLQRKCEIVAAGCRKRGRLKEAEYYLRMIEETVDHADHIP